MAKVIPSPAGQRITLCAGLEARHRSLYRCRARVVTEGGEQAVIHAGKRFNGKFTSETGFAVLGITCPACGRQTEIDTDIWLATATTADFRYFRS